MFHSGLGIHEQRFPPLRNMDMVIVDKEDESRVHAIIASKDNDSQSLLLTLFSGSQEQFNAIDTDAGHKMKILSLSAERIQHLFSSKNTMTFKCLSYDPENQDKPVVLTKQTPSKEELQELKIFYMVKAMSNPLKI